MTDLKEKILQAINARLTALKKEYIFCEGDDAFHARINAQISEAKHIYSIVTLVIDGARIQEEFKKAHKRYSYNEKEGL